MEPPHGNNKPERRAQARIQSVGHVHDAQGDVREARFFVKSTNDVHERRFIPTQCDLQGRQPDYSPLALFSPDKFLRRPCAIGGTTSNI
jgi:hypothetical protein